MGAGREGCLRASNTSLGSPGSGESRQHRPSDELETPFPPNKIFKVHLVCPPPHCPDGYWRLAVAPMALAEGDQQREAPEWLQYTRTESEIRQSGRYGEKGHPNSSPPGSASP